jgi:hypothetical protein
MPSTKALCPPTKNGTSAPSVAPSSSSLARPVQVPQPVQRQQHGGSVGTAAAQAGAPGHLLVDRDARPCAQAGSLLQRARRAQAQVVDRQRWPRSTRSSRPSSSRSTWIVSAQSISTKGDCSRWYPSARRPTTCRNRFSLAGAGRSKKARTLTKRLLQPHAHGDLRRRRAHGFEPAGPVSGQRHGPPQLLEAVGLRRRRRARPRSAGQPVGKGAQRQRLAQRVARQGFQVGVAGRSLPGVQHHLGGRPACGRQHGTQRRTQPQFTATAVAAQIEVGTHVAAPTCQTVASTRTESDRWSRAWRHRPQGRVAHPTSSREPGATTRTAPPAPARRITGRP